MGNDADDRDDITRMPESSPPANDAQLLRRIVSAQNEIAAVAHDPVQVVDVVARRALDLTHSEGAAVEIFDDGDMVYLASAGIAQSQNGLRMPANGSLSGLCVERDEVLICEDAERDPRVNLEACRRVGLCSMLVVPLLHAGKPIGVLKVMSSQPGAYRDSDVQTMRMMATLIGAVLGHSISHSALVEQYRGRLEADTARANELDNRRNRITDVIQHHDIRTVYQPVMRLADRHVVAYEALSRFPEGSATPDRWFAQAAEAGVGNELEIEAARTALERLDGIPRPLKLSLNVSPETLVSDEFNALLKRHDMARLVLEITEHTTVADYDRLCECIRDLKASGVQLAIDDAGAGFASLRHILHLAPDVIKLDISLVRRIDRDTRRQTLVLAILAFASGTGAHVVVEGIETEDELATLIRLGVKYGQGYYLGRPAPLPSD